MCGIAHNTQAHQQHDVKRWILNALLFFLEGTTSSSKMTCRIGSVHHRVERDPRGAPKSAATPLRTRKHRPNPSTHGPSDSTNTFVCVCVCVCVCVYVNQVLRKHTQYDQSVAGSWFANVFVLVALNITHIILWQKECEALSLF